MSEATKIDSEHSLSAVPKSERRGFWNLVFTWIGYVFTVTIMSAGGNIANGAANFWQCMAAVYTGYGLLFLLALLVSYISQTTGYSFGLLTRYSFGSVGSRLISFFTMVTLLGWFSINCYLSGSITHILFPVIPQIPASIFFGALYTFTAMKGQKIMNQLGLVATVLGFAVGMIAIILGIRDAGGFTALTSIQHEQTKTFNDLVTLAVGSVVCGVVGWVPDIMRFSKGTKTSLGVMAVGMGLAGPFMLVIGIIGMMVYQQYDIALILQEQGFLAFAFVGLIGNIWSTAQGNVYSSGLNLASIFTKTSREKLILIFGACGILLGTFGLYRYFSSWLSFLATVFPPMGGVVIANYFFVWKQKLPAVEKTNFPSFFLLSFVAFAIGIASKYVVHFGLTTINALVISFVAEIIFGSIYLTAQANAIRAEAEKV